MAMAQLSENLFFEALHDGKLLSFKLNSSDEVTIDAWHQKVEEELTAWDAEYPYLSMYDMTSDGVIFTLYMREKSESMNDLRQDVSGRVALVMEPSMAERLMKSFAKKLKVDHSREIKIFFNQRKALAWLEELIKE